MCAHAGKRPISHFGQLLWSIRVVDAYRLLFMDYPDGMDVACTPPERLRPSHPCDCVRSMSICYLVTFGAEKGTGSDRLVQCLRDAGGSEIDVRNLFQYYHRLDWIFGHTEHLHWRGTHRNAQEQMRELYDPMLEEVLDEAFTQVMRGLGYNTLVHLLPCVAGRHRSVAFVELLRQKLEMMPQLRVRVFHLDNHFRGFSEAEAHAFGHALLNTVKHWSKPLFRFQALHRQTVSNNMSEPSSLQS